MVSDGERTAMASADASDGMAQYQPRIDGPPAAEPPGEEYSAGLPSWHLITAAIRRGTWLWATMALLGLIIGTGLYSKHASYQASTSVVLVPNPTEIPTDAILTDVALAQSHTVAALAVRNLRLPESASSFLASYKVTSVTDRVLTITLTAPTSSAAVSRAHAVATAFLQYRAQQFRIQQQQTLTALQQQVTQAKQQIATLNRKIGQLTAQPATPAQQARLSALQQQRLEAQTQLPALQQAVTSDQVTTRMTTTQLIQGSQILDAAAPSSAGHFKHIVLYIGGGLAAGLVLGLVIVIVRALVSDRLRRRDDVAQALDVPVRLSVTGQLTGHGLAAASRPGIRRIVAYLRELLPQVGTQPAALAVVAVDELRTPALSLVSLALACARDGQQVVLADLCPGAPAARLLNQRRPGIGVAEAEGARLVVAVPGDQTATGPLPRPGTPGPPPAPELAQACAAADVLLTLVQLDPALGGEHLATWARTVVVTVTAGRSSWTKIHAVGEMTRLAGTPPVSALLLEADPTDESLGAAQAASGPAPAGPRSAPVPPVEVDPARRITSR
jgi:capsular polysaccharide biosynthesis protein